MPKRIEVSLDLLDTELESLKMRQVSLGLVLLVSEFLLGSGNNICHRYTGDISLYIYIYCLVGRTTSFREAGKMDITTEAASMPRSSTASSSCGKGFGWFEGIPISPIRFIQTLPF